MNGKLDGADDFGGSEWINTSDSPSLDITDEITLSAWIYLDGATGWYQDVVRIRFLAEC